MQLTQPNTSTVSVVADDGERLDFNVSVFNHTRFKSVDNAFRDINRFWNTLPIPRRKAIFAVYKRIHEHFVSLRDVGKGRLNLEAFGRELTSMVAQLYQYMPIEEMEQWVNRHGEISYPKTLKEQHDIDEPMPDKTYLISDYRGLVVLTAILRPMVPIWGEYIKLIIKSVGTLFKEYIAINLLSATPIQYSKQYERLRRYIECCITNDIDTRGAVVAGISKSEIPEWLLAIVIVRRLSVGDIDADDNTGNIITNVYGFVNTTLTDLNPKFGTVREKYDPEGSNDDETSSNLEGYRPKQTASTGDIMIFNVYTQELYTMAKEIDPTVPEELVHMCKRSISVMHNYEITKPHMALLQWVMAEAISPQAIASLYKEPLLNTMAVTQALLIHWKFELLALLLNSVGQVPDNGTVLASVATKINSQLMDKLNIYYPYTINSGGNNKPQNPGATAVFKMSAIINSCRWVCNASSELLQHIGYTLETPRLKLIHRDMNISDQLASLVIYTNEKPNWSKSNESEV